MAKTSSKSRHSIPLVQLALVSPMLNELEIGKESIPGVLARHSVHPSDVNDPDAFVSAQVMYGLVEDLAELSSDPFFGVSCGAKLNPWSWSPLAEAVKGASSVADCLVKFMQAAGKHASTVEYELSARGPQTEFRERRLIRPDRTPAHNDGFTVAYLLAIVRGALGDKWKGERAIIRVSEPRSVPAQYLGAHIAETDRMGSSVLFPTEWLLEPLSLKPGIRSSAETLAVSVPLSSRQAFRSLLKGHLADQDLDAAKVARICGLHLRTLNRRLKAIGTSVRQEQTHLRKEIAQDLLLSSNVTVAELASRLGYRDPAVFSRAFKRWTGHSPMDWKRKNKSD